MMPKITLSLTCAAFAAVSLHAQEGGEKITYQDHIRPLLENKCFSCHNPDKKKGDLDLTSFGALMTGGGGGVVVDPGNVDGSRLWTTCAKKEEPFMPPEGAPLGTKELDLLAAWVKGGVLETKSSIAKKSAKPKVDMAVAVTSGKPEGPIAKPEHVLLEPVIVTPRTTAITAMAASPWTSLTALAAPKQILLYDTDTQQLAGIFPYTEGYARSLRFSRNGSLLIMGGGRAGKNGSAIVWDVKTGKRITEVGKEFDQVMSADISPDHKRIVIGSPSKKVKCYNTATGEEEYVISKHTEWIMGTAFSPDGVLLATSDRNGNVMVWESENGGEFYILGQHKASCVDLAWRADSNLLASCSVDGSIMVWEMNEGKKVKDWAAHGGGVQSISFTPDGKIVSAGNDGLVRVWDINGNKLGEAPGQGDLVTKIVALHDSKSAISANWRGEIIQWNITAAALTESGRLSSNPSLISQRIVQAEQRMAELNAKLPSLQEAVKKAEADAKARDEALAKTRAEVAATEARSKNLPGEIANDEKALAALKAARAKADQDKAARIAAIKAHGEKSAKIAAQEKELAPVAAEAAKVPAADKAVADATAALEGAKVELAAKAGDAALTAKVKELEGKLAAAKAEQQKIAPQKAKADQLAAAIAKAKAELGAAPVPVADLDKLIVETDAKIKATADGINAKKAELPKLLALVKGGPDRIKGAEGNATVGRNALAAAQTAVKTVSNELGVLQKVPTALKAAQFNTGVLVEKEKLAKLEEDFTDFTEAKKDAEAAKVSAAARIEDSKKAIANSTAAQPGLEATLKKAQGEQAALETSIKPTRDADAAAAAKVNEQKQIITTKEAEIAAANKTKDESIAAAKKSAEDIAKAIGDLKKKLGEVAGKAAGPEKNYQDKKQNFMKLEGALATAKKAATDAAADAATKAKAQKDAETAVATANTAVQNADKAANEARNKTNAAKQPVQPAKNAADAAEKALADAKAKNQANPQLEQAVNDAKGKLAAAEKAVADSEAAATAAFKDLEAKKAAKQTAGQTYEAAKNASGTAASLVTKTTSAAKQAEQQLGNAKNEYLAAEKQAMPLIGQRDSINKEIEAQSKALAEKQAAPANIEKDTAAKIAPLNAAIAAAKTALPPLEQAYAAAHGKLDAEQKILDAKKAEVAKANGDFEGAKKKKTDAEATIAAATKEIPEKDKITTEATAELAKLQPQLDPMRTKVKQMTDQYFAMLPK
jgi:chromosome segregation ATPase